MEQYWFKAYKYGYGWFPVSWRGWVVTLVYAVQNMYGVVFFQKYLVDRIDTLIAFSPVFILSTILFLIIVVKTGEKAHWRRGKDNN
jgi:hypothetical protein